MATPERGQPVSTTRQASQPASSPLKDVPLTSVSFACQRYPEPAILKPLTTPGECLPMGSLSSLLRSGSPLSVKLG